MNTKRTDARKQLLETAATIFKDVITGEPARTEEELSAILTLFHNWGRIQWNQVRLEAVNATGVSGEVIASSIGIAGLTAVCEYPLFCEPGSPKMGRQGKFRADILFLGKSAGPLIYVEAKIDTSIRSDLILAVLQYLEEQKRFSPASFVILKPREIDQRWYVGELLDVMKTAGLKLEKTKAYVMYWEDVFKACDAA